MSALGKVVRAGVGRRRAQTVVMVLTTLVAVAASVVAVGVLAASRAPFAQAMDAARGAHLTARFDGGAAGGPAASATASGVSAAAGPFRILEAEARTGSGTGPEIPAGVRLPSMTVVGRADPAGPVDQLSLVEGEWADAPGELVLAEETGGPLPPGARLEFPGLPGAPTLTVVGVARSVTGTADAWVTPEQAAALAAPGEPAAYQMLYQLRDAGSEAAVDAGRAAIAAAVPEGTLTGTRSYLAVRQEMLANTLAFVPFVAAFGVLGLAMSVLIIGIVVSGAVGSARRRIGVLKVLGFTPGQVVRAYVVQALVPAVLGCVLGAALGRVLAGPVLGTVEDAYAGAPAGLPGWVYGAVSAVALTLVATAALVPALRAGRLPATAALTVGRGRTPGGGRGRRVRRLAGRLPVPRPVSLGLAQPFARPARSATTGAAVALAALTVTFAVGLALSLGAVQSHRTLDSAAPVVVDLGPAGGPPGAQAVPAPGQEPVSAPADPDRVAAALRAHPDTRRFYGTTGAEVTASGVSGPTSVSGYTGDARWGAPALVSGRWFEGPGEAVVTERFLRAAGVAVGGTVTLSAPGRETTVRIVGAAFFTENDGMTVLTPVATLGALGLDTAPGRFHAEPGAGVSASAYLSALGTALDGSGALAHSGGDDSSSVIVAMNALIAMLTLLLVVVAGLGVLNTAVLDTRDRVHALGVHRALGMTPRQTVGMVLTSVGAVGLVAGVVGVPLGVLLHRRVVPLMGDAVGMRLPEPFVAVHSAPLLALLALGGLAVAVAGALLPAGWAARVDAGRALRAE